MERMLRRIGSGIVISLYFVWILAVVALLITRLAPGPVPAIVNWTVTAGATVGFMLGTIVILCRSPKYLRQFHDSLFR